MSCIITEKMKREEKSSPPKTSTSISLKLGLASGGLELCVTSKISETDSEPVYDGSGAEKYGGGGVPAGIRGNIEKKRV
jgi:hypothetical protein